eukprot:359108-Chlamydomonas_euryale.AAC.2
MPSHGEVQDAYMLRAASQRMQGMHARLHAGFGQATPGRTHSHLRMCTIHRLPVMCFHAESGGRMHNHRRRHAGRPRALIHAKRGSRMHHHRREHAGRLRALSMRRGAAACTTGGSMLVDLGRLSMRREATARTACARHTPSASTCQARMPHAHKVAAAHGACWHNHSTDACVRGSAWQYGPAALGTPRGAKRRSGR